MPRYIRQRDLYSCGPVAILNALKWVGRSVSYKTHYRKIAKDCKTLEGSLEERGTYSSDLNRVLRKVTSKYCKIIKVRSCSIEQLDAHLRSGGAAILAHLEASPIDPKNPEGHFSFWFESDGRIFIGANDGALAYRSKDDKLKVRHENGKTVIARTRSQMVRKLRKTTRSGSYPEVWLLTKNKG